MLGQPVSRPTRCILLFFFGILSGCSDSPPADQVPAPSLAHPVSSGPSAVEQDIFDRQALIEFGQNTLQQSLEAAVKLQNDINNLLKNPSAEAHASVAKQWREAVNAFEPFSPIVKLAQSSALLKQIPAAHYQIAHSPIQPGYLDAFGAHAFSGLVFDIGIPINEHALREQHGMMDKEGVTLGFYALEYLLFGELDQRSFLIFKPVTTLSTEHKEQGYTATEEIPRNRRRALIEQQAQLLVNDLSVLNIAWKEGTGNSRLQDESNLPLAQQLANIRPSELQTNIKNGIRQLVAEQMISIVELNQSGHADQTLKDWQNRQLAQKLKAQYIGIVKVLEITQPLYSREAINAALVVAKELEELAENPPVAEPVTDQTANNKPVWKPVTTALQAFAEFTRKTHLTPPT